MIRRRFACYAAGYFSLKNSEIPNFRILSKENGRPPKLWTTMNYSEPFVRTIAPGGDRWVVTTRTLSGRHAARVKLHHTDRDSQSRNLALYWRLLFLCVRIGHLKRIKGKLLQTVFALENFQSTLVEACSRNPTFETWQSKFAVETWKVKTMDLIRQKKFSIH